MCNHLLSHLTSSCHITPGVFSNLIFITSFHNYYGENKLLIKLLSYHRSYKIQGTYKIPEQGHRKCLIKAALFLSITYFVYSYKKLKPTTQK